MKALPWWLRWLVLPAAILFLVGWFIIWLIGVVLHALLYVAVGAIVVAALLYTGRRIGAALTGGRRRRRREQAALTGRTISARRGSAPEPGSPDYLRQFRDVL